MNISSKYSSNDGIAWRGMVVATLMALIFLSGCDARGADESAQAVPPEVDVAEVLAEPVTLTETFTGRLQAPETVLLRPRVTGYVQEVAFNEGALVEAGDLLFQIDPRPYQAQLNAARAELAESRSQLQLAASEARRAGLLLAEQAISNEEHDQRQAALSNAQARVERSQAAVELAELDMQYTRVVSPVSGLAGRAEVTRGNLANADQTLLTTVVSVDPLYVYFDSSESMALSNHSLLSGGKRRLQVRIGVSGDEGFPYQGELDYVANQVNVSTGTLQYRAVLDNPRGLLKPGQFARVKMPVARLEQALLVSRKAVLTDQDRRYVYVVDADDTVSRREVTTGREVGDLLVIHAGLERGERVIVNGLQRVLGAGMQVSPRRVAMRDAPLTGNASLAAAATQATMTETLR